jgi:hypothetical protein
MPAVTTITIMMRQDTLLIESYAMNFRGEDKKIWEGILPGRRLSIVQTARGVVALLSFESASGGSAALTRFRPVALA